MLYPVRSSLRTLGAAAVSFVALSGSAMATVVTLNPAASSPALTTSGSSQFSADGAIVADYVSANIKSELIGETCERSVTAFRFAIDYPHSTCP